MSKCPVCNSRKGKRRCLIADGSVCSLCCGKTRSADSCLECQYYQQPKKNYSEVPAYTTSQMANNQKLEAYGSAIEGALCAFDIKIESKLKDAEAIKILELLIDIYHFGDETTEASSQTISDGLEYVNGVVKSDLEGVDPVIVTKILGVLRFVARRRTKVGREYMAIIHQYVGLRVGKGMRILDVSDLEK